MKRCGPAVSVAFIAALVSTSLQAGSKSEAGLYDFQHFSATEYAASPQNWAVVQDRRGVMYFANTDGVLQYDGASWRLLKPAPAVSIAIDASDTVYVGGESDFGFLKPDGAGNMHFTSLLAKVPASDRKFGLVWNVLPAREGIYFNATDRLFRLNPDGTLRTWRPVSRFGFVFYLRGEIYVKTPEGGLQKLVRDVFSPVPGGTAFGNDRIVTADSLGGTTLFGTPNAIFRLTDAGIVPFKTEADEFFRANALRSLKILSNGQIAAGTKERGLAVLRADGALERLVGSAEGLPGDSVLAIQPDRQGGEWLAQVNGIARFNPAVTHFGDGQGLSSGSLVISIARLGEDLYIGTAVGLFRMAARPGSLPRFEKVEGAGGPIHALLPFGDSLIVGRDAGLSVVRGLVSTGISIDSPVVYDISPSQASRDVVFEAARDVVARLTRTADGWKETSRVSGPGANFYTVLESPDGRVWATTTGDEIWRIDFRRQPPAIEKYGKADGVTGSWKSAYRFGGRVVFGTSTGLIKFDESRKRFVPDNSLGAQFADGSHGVSLISEDPSGNVWVTGKDYHGILRRHPGGFTWEPMTFAAQDIRQIYALLPEADGTVWVSGEGKLHRWESGLAANPNGDFKVLTRISTNGAEEPLFGGAGALPKIRLPYRSNSLRFEFAAPFYEQRGTVEYQMRLEGSDSDWTPWTRDVKKEYTQLWEGHYKFHVRARNPHGVSEESVSGFSIIPPWYRSWWAFILYAMGGAVFVWGVVKFRVRQLQEDKRQLEQTVAERTVEIRQQRDEIHVQERRSQSLLLNILPAQVAEELKSTGAVKPEGFEDVTVCFTDFVGFTLSSEKMPPASLVDALNEYFTAFDEIIARYGLEKLKTIGDSYMFVSGLPERRASHAVDAVMAAIEMVRVVKDLAAKTDGTGWNIRVGLHSGPVVAGVVGIRKFAFDIWGNTVNFAARMESSGVPGSVNMSERTCKLTRGLIECEARGHVRIKEGRELPMFLASAVVPNFAPRYEAEFGVAPRSMPSFGSVAAASAATHSASR